MRQHGAGDLRKAFPGRCGWRRCVANPTRSRPYITYAPNLATQEVLRPMEATAATRVLPTPRVLRHVRASPLPPAWHTPAASAWPTLRRASAAFAHDPSPLAGSGGKRLVGHLHGALAMVSLAERRARAARSAMMSLVLPRAPDTHVRLDWPGSARRYLGQ